MHDNETATSLSVSDIDRVILFISKFLPARGAVVSPGEGVTDALAAEQVATLGRDHKPSTLDDLEKIKTEARVRSTVTLNHLYL